VFIGGARNQAWTEIGEERMDSTKRDPKEFVPSLCNVIQAKKN
jgi:hypothetical protein